MSGFRERGAAPKRSEERVRRNEPTVPVTRINVAELIAREVEIPKADDKWHNVARWWYDSLAESAQCVYYEPSDWATAYLMATNLSRQLKSQVIAYDMEEHKLIKAVKPLNGSDLGAFLKGCTNLLVTEVDRRRAGIEVERAIQNSDLEAMAAGDESGVVSNIEDARSAAIGN